jgi:hypothetical protein
LRSGDRPTSTLAVTEAPTAAGGETSWLRRHKILAWTTGELRVAKTLSISGSGVDANLDFDEHGKCVGLELLYSRLTKVARIDRPTCRRDRTVRVDLAAVPGHVECPAATVEFAEGDPELGSDFLVRLTPGVPQVWLAPAADVCFGLAGEELAAVLFTGCRRTAP